MNRIWEAVCDPDRYLCVQHPGLLFFRDHFQGELMGATWEAPEFEILNKNKKVADFTSWQIGSQTALVSARAREVIERLCGDDVEFLPFTTIKRTELFALNVVRQVSVIDWSRSETGAAGPTSIKFHEAVMPPPLFKDPKLLSWTFASDALGRAAVDHGLTGLRLADPAKNRLRQIVERLPINEFIGL